MRILLDTGVVLRFAAPQDPLHSQVTASLLQLEEEGHELVVIPQVLRECWVVMTRPASSNGSGLTPDEAAEFLAQIRSAFQLVDDSAGLLDVWQALVLDNEVSGRQAHDANIVAAIKFHGLDAILTLNAQDFRRYDGFQILTP